MTAVLSIHRAWLVPASAFSVVGAGLIVALGFDAVVAKVVDFALGQIHSITTMDVFIAVLCAVLLAELALVGYRKSSVYHFVHPSKSTTIDIYVLIFYLTGLAGFLAAFVTVGATEWAPMIVRRLALVDSHALTDNAWLSVSAYHLSRSFITYWCHRWGHACEWWWEVHRFHHTATELNLINSMRDHPLDMAYRGVTYSIPMMFFGDEAVVPSLALGVVMLVHTFLNHSNLPWSFGWLGRYVISSPRYHQVHHSILAEHHDKNFCGRLIVWDWMFGTRYAGSVDVPGYGVLDDPLADKTFLSGIVHSAMRSYRKLGKALVRTVRLGRCGATREIVSSMDDTDYGSPKRPNTGAVA